MPHIGNEEMGESAEKAVEKYSSEFELKAITDEQVILVEDSEVKVLK